jgi:hypothetical protein
VPFLNQAGKDLYEKIKKRFNASTLIEDIPSGNMPLCDIYDNEGNTVVNIWYSAAGFWANFVETELRLSGTFYNKNEDSFLDSIVKIAGHKITVY